MVPTSEMLLNISSKSVSFCEIYNCTHLRPIGGRDLAAPGAAEAGHGAVDDTEDDEHLHRELQDPLVTTEELSERRGLHAL